MTGSAEMKLIFRLEGVGFSLPVNLLVEIVELEVKPQRSTEKDSPPWPQIDFRGSSIPVIDLAGSFGLSEAPEGEELTMLVLYGELGCWGALVREVEGIRANAEFEERKLSPLFSLGGGNLYDNIDIWRSEPLIQFDPDRFAPRGDAT